MPLIVEEYATMYAKEPFHSCGLSGGFIGSFSVNNCDFLIHGSSGCGFAMRYGLAQHWKSFIPAPVTNLSEKNVIFGSEKLLYDALKEFCENSSSEITFVLATCSASIIGEDYKKVCDELSNVFQKDIIFVDTGGLDLLEGYSRFLLEIVKFYISKRNINFRLCQKETAPFLVDIMGIVPMYDMFWRGDFKEITRLLKLLECDVRSFFTGDIDVGRLRSMEESNCIINLNNSVGRKACRYLEKVGNKTIFSFDYLPIGFKYTGIFLKTIGRGFNISEETLDELISNEETRIKRLMLRGYDFTKIMFSAAKIAVIGNPAWVCPLVNFLVNEVGMCCKLVAFTAKADDEFIKEINDNISNSKEEIIFLNGVDNYYIKSELKRIRPNVIFGRSLDRIPENDNAVFITWQFPSSNHFVLKDVSILGYEGVITILDKIVNGFCEKWY